MGNLKNAKQGETVSKDSYKSVRFEGQKEERESGKLAVNKVDHS